MNKSTAILGVGLSMAVNSRVPLKKGGHGKVVDVLALVANARQLALIVFASPISVSECFG